MVVFNRGEGSDDDGDEEDGDDDVSDGDSDEEEDLQTRGEEWKEAPPGMGGGENAKTRLLMWDGRCMALTCLHGTKWDEFTGKEGRLGSGYSHVM